MLTSYLSKRLFSIFSSVKMATQVSDIPTVAQLYQLKKLSPPAAETSTSVTPSKAINNKVSIFRGNITRLEVDAIVNAANKYLAGGGGVDGAIHAAAGPGLLQECSTLGGCKTGSAKITSAYELPCKKVIHAVGPVYSRSEPEESATLLASCYTTSLQLAVDNDCKTVVFSGLSTGVYGYPSQYAASVATKAVRGFLEGASGDKIDRVIFCTFEMKDVNAYNDWVP
jgi:O-acetyl-ADP-ribose deacetylase (regulator of RNase III)